MPQNIFQKAYHSDLNRVYEASRQKQCYLLSKASQLGSLADKDFSTIGGEIILDNVIGDIPDIQKYFEELKKNIDKETRVLISYHNPIWEPVLNFASFLGLRKKIKNQNWLDQDDLANILNLSGFEVISIQKRFFGITAITIAKQKTNNLRSKNNDYSVSIIVPARNEEGNIEKIVKSIPKFGKNQEIVFIEGGSKDKTWEVIGKQVEKYKNNKFIRIKSFKQKGKGKADAVKLGFEKATNDIFMIYDADRTVPASDLPKFYNVLANGLGDFANGSRLVYPMEDQAMQTLNKMGNQFFGFVFTWILGQHFKDTLCGTKVFWKKDFEKMKKDYLKYLKIDPFGDFALIFSAIKHNLKVIEVPIRYKEREYGSTNIRRFYHGLLLFKLAWIGLKEFKL